ncbi:DUF4416 family protein [Dissulfurirhabdus thermomarina]|uniref:DUF4416 family protein n=1 Tax=Dissulfurirhabdus thermomarina TaxID=1765737 RepID=A0A6N9TSX1_DISTH|nr:DUF4416 family protein [Dissulfurirhabdus thermomarina]NDY41636.1 DUF4416 family protein [Dissulfurirhabdus thermomarina]NMX23321.1 DUF4416 family protein [Dissulfurirhabdus thermomarina]
MSILGQPPPAKPVAGLLFRDPGWVERVRRALGEHLGAADLAGKPFPFDCTDYYEGEFGPGLSRAFVGFERLVPQDYLKDFKLLCHALERRWSEDGRRRVNIDPGLLTAERLVVATGKNYSHRVYLGEGVFADLQLVYYQGSFQPLPWTYADYKRPDVVAFWNRARSGYLGALGRARRR